LWTEGPADRFMVNASLIKEKANDEITHSFKKHAHYTKEEQYGLTFSLIFFVTRNEQ